MPLELVLSGPVALFPSSMSSGPSCDLEAPDGLLWRFRNEYVYCNLQYLAGASERHATRMQDDKRQSRLGTPFTEVVKEQKEARQQYTVCVVEVCLLMCDNGKCLENSIPSDRLRVALSDDVSLTAFFIMPPPGFRTCRGLSVSNLTVVPSAMLKDRDTRSAGHVLFLSVLIPLG